MNVVVFALHGCPVSALGPYGNEWIGTPQLDRLAAEGIVFDRHLSDCPVPIAARRAWRTGCHQFTPTSSGDLLASLKARGVRTLLVRNNRVENDVGTEFYAGWDEMFDARPDADDESLLSVLPNVLDRLAGERAWLLWIELDRLLPPWDVRQDVFEAYIEGLLEDEPAEEEEDEPPDEEPETEPVLPWADPPVGWFDRDDLASWELLHRTFAAVVTVFDAELGRVFDLLRSRGLDRTAAWVFTADRGFPLGEHRQLGPHRPWLHEELVHVPLIVRLAEAREAGRRIPGLTQPADLCATLAAWLGAETQNPDGFDLAPLLAGTVEAIRPFACSVLEVESAAEWAIRTPEWAYLLPVRFPPEDEPREPMLFEKPDDRWEVNDQRQRMPEKADELERMLREAVTRRG